MKEVAAGISGAVNTAAGISPDVITSGNDNSAIDDPTTAGISAAAGISADGVTAAGISAAGISEAVGNSGVGKSLAVDGVEESPMSVEGSQVGDDEAEINLEPLKVSGSEEMTAGGGGLNGTSSDDEHKKLLISLSKTCESLCLSAYFSVCLPACCLSLSVCLSACLPACLGWKKNHDFLNEKIRFLSFKPDFFI